MVRSKCTVVTWDISKYKVRAAMNLSSWPLPPIMVLKPLRAESRAPDQRSERQFVLPRIYGPLLLHLMWRALASGQCFCDSLRKEEKIASSGDFPLHYD